MDLSQNQWAAQAQEDNNAVILDVRTPMEWEEGIIPGAIMIDIYRGQGFIDDVSQLDKDRNYYVYCKAGSRSHQACQVMNSLGFLNTYNLLGGFSQWQGPVDRP